jgi:tetraacyldisaccharide-1-P 4'-kinase
MTEKDWVKCGEFVDEKMWYLEIDASLNDFLVDTLIKDLTSLIKLEKFDHKNEDV